MPSKATREECKRAIRRLWIGLFIYFLVFVNAVRYVGRVPYRMVLLGAGINALIIIGFGILIRRAYKKLQSDPVLNDPSASLETKTILSKGTTEERNRAIRPLWIGFFIYFLAFVNALRYVGRVPYWMVLLGGGINALLIIGFVVVIRRAYKKLQK